MVICLSKYGARSVKASAAHIAFLAWSCSVVDACFYAAVKAGGRVHGKPAVRDQQTGYYSAAVLDFDNNSIEFVYREKKLETSGTPSGVSEEHRVLRWQKEVARSTVGSDVKPEKSAARIVINNITTPTTTASSPQPEPNSGSEMSAKAVVGTLLGAAAGAAVAYAMTKGEEESQKVSASRQVLYQAIEAARPSLARSVTDPGRSYSLSNVSNSSRTGPRELDYPPSTVSHASHGVQSHTSPSDQRPGPLAIGSPLKLSTLIDIFVPPSEVQRFRPQSLVRSRTDGPAHSPSGNRVIDEPPRRSDSHSCVSSAKTITQANFRQRQSPSVVTEIRTARGVPLSESRASSVTLSRAPPLRRLVLEGGHDDDTRSVLQSVAPSDSVSQAGSKRSKGSRRSSGLSSRHRSENSRERTKHRGDDGGSRTSERTVRAGGRSSERKKGSVVSLPMRPASKTSLHRSVKSFIPGM